MTISKLNHLTLKPDLEKTKNEPLIDRLEDAKKEIAQLIALYSSESLPADKTALSKSLSEITHRIPAVKKYFFYQNEFYRALIQKEIQKVEAHLNQTRYFFDFNPHFGLTCVHLAIITSSKELLQLFIDHHFPVDAVDNIGKTALHYAALCEDDVFFAMLIDNGASPLIKDNNNVSALDLLVYQKAKILS